MRAGSLLASEVARWVQRPAWLTAFVVAVVLAGTSYGVAVAFLGSSALDRWRLGYGVAAAVLMVGAALLGVRRRTMRWGWGRAQDWVQFHVYGGALSLLLVAMHTGFHWPQGALTRWLLVLAAWVTAGGLVGVALRKWLPRVLTSSLSIEVPYERIPELARELEARARTVVQSSPAVLRDFHRKRIAPGLGKPVFRWSFLIDTAGSIGRRIQELELLRRVVSAEHKEICDQLEAIYRHKLELDAHFTLQRGLRWWLYGHLPPSFALLFLTAAHVVIALSYS